jgi:hypothetical protein
MGSWSNGTTPPWRGGDPSSTLGGSTVVVIWKVAGYGWPDRFAKAAPRTGMRVRIPCLPLAVFFGPDGETDIIPRFERGVPGSSPGRGADTSDCRLSILDGCGRARLIWGRHSSIGARRWGHPLGCARLHPSGFRNRRASTWRFRTSRAEIRTARRRARCQAIPSSTREKPC